MDLEVDVLTGVCYEAKTTNVVILQTGEKADVL